VPSQMCGAGLPLGSVSKDKQRRTSLYGAKAQAPAGGKIERLGIASDIGDNAGHRPAGQGFLCDPKQFPHFGNAYDQELSWIEAEREKTRPIGQAKKLPITGKLQVENRDTPGVQERSCLPKGKAEAGTPIAHGIGENLLQQASGQLGKVPVLFAKRARAGFRQGRLALDIGNSIPQRGKALLAILGLHDPTTT